MRRLLHSLILMTLAAAPLSAQIMHVSPQNGSLAVRLDVDALRAADERFIVESFPLPGSGAVDLELEPFRVVADDAVFVLGTDGGDIPFEVDASSYVFLRGRAPDVAGSHVILAINDRSTIGRVELGAGRPTYGLAGKGGQIRVFKSTWAGMPTLCGVEAFEHGAAPIGEPQPQRGLRLADLAIDADFELYSLFNDEQAAIDYLVMLYAQVSDLTLRDARTRLELIFVRVWTTPNDPYGDGVGFPFIDPNEVPYEVAQLLSGRKDASAGGVATLCGLRSWVAYALGFFTEVDTPNIYTQDIFIAAHEIGHNLGTPHTHDLGVDQCNTHASPTRRGPLMSYCTQTHSGGSALGDLRYHTACQERIAMCLANRPDVLFDCNQNGVDDSIDLAMGFSEDMNVNGIPDECEDCNGNGVLDPDDILFGFSEDVNGNEIPDECEPDCNANGVPDSWDIMLGTSIDLYGNGVPDECEGDCNGNGVSDYNELQEDMTRDYDRDAVLDACQDCDLDGVSDMETLNGANNAWAISSDDDRIKEYHAISGAPMRASEPGHLANAMDLMITPDARILVTSSADDRVVEFDRTGAYVGDLVPTGVGGLDLPGAMLLLGEDLLVASTGTDEVLRYDVVTGDFLGVFAAAGEGGLEGPYALGVGANGAILISSDDDRVLEFDKAGTFIRVFIDDTDNGGLISPRAIVVVPDGRVVVSSEFTDNLLAFDPVSGAFLGVYQNGDYNGHLEGPWGLRVGPDGHVYAGASHNHEDGGGHALHLTDPRIFKYDGANGNLYFPYVQALDSELEGARGFDFMPGDGDCNLNLIPDACDIASGVSQDGNDNGVPDECEGFCAADVTGDGVLNVLDFVYFQLAWQDEEPAADCNDDGEYTILDFVCFQQLFVLGCG